MKERKITTHVADIIRRDKGLAHVINRTDQIDDIVAALEEPLFVPEFSVDYLLRKKYARAARHAIDQLTVLEIVSVDTSISGVKGEILRPDIVAYNAERASFVLIEVKKENQTEREAITELIAYEQELKNHFPFLSKRDVVFVTISTKWSTLLEHAISSLVTWQNYTCLCIHANIAEDEIELSVAIPAAWRLLESARLPYHALTTVHLCPYDKKMDISIHDEAVMMRQMLSALTLIARDADRAGSHGFALLWRDHSHKSESTFVITIGVINPHAFLQHSFMHDVWNRDSDLHRFFKQKSNDNLAEAYDFVEYDHVSSSETIGYIAENARRLLKETGRPRLEGFSIWEDAYHEMHWRAEPSFIEFWGALDEFYTEFVLKEGVRTSYMPFLNHQSFFLRDARPGLMLLKDLTLGRAFMNGRITCSFCFLLGVQLESLALTQRWISVDERKTAQLLVLKWWQELGLTSVLADIGLWLQSVEDITVDPPLISFGGMDPSEDNRPQLSELASWVAEQLIGPLHPFHRKLFEKGLDLAPCIHQYLFNILPEGLQCDCKKRLSEAVYEYLPIAIEEYIESKANGSTRDGMLGLLREILEKCNVIYSDNDIIPTIKDYRCWLPMTDDLILSDIFVPYVLPLFDWIVPPVVHRLGHPQPAKADWNWLRVEIERMRAESRGIPAVIYGEDGSISSGLIDPDLIGCPIKDVSDPATSVWLVVEYSGLRKLSETRWEELIDGSAFAT